MQKKEYKKHIMEMIEELSPLSLAEEKTLIRTIYTEKGNAVDLKVEKFADDDILTWRLYICLNYIRRGQELGCWADYYPNKDIEKNTFDNLWRRFRKEAFFDDVLDLI